MKELSITKAGLTAQDHPAEIADARAPIFLEINIAARPELKRLRPKTNPTIHIEAVGRLVIMMAPQITEIMPEKSCHPQPLWGFTSNA